MHRHGDVELQVCRYCSGVWITQEQLASKCVRTEALPVGSRQPAPTLRHKPPSARICSQCDALLRAQFVDGIEIDLCPHCGGLWLDAGEFDAVHTWYLARDTRTPKRRGSSSPDFSGAGDIAEGAFRVGEAVTDGSLGEIVEFLCSAVGGVLEGL